jgi:hypothetical protein
VEATPGMDGKVREVKSDTRISLLDVIIMDAKTQL